jgi:hypothetical protein
MSCFTYGIFHDDGDIDSELARNRNAMHTEEGKVLSVLYEI